MIVAENLVKIYKTLDVEVQALQGLDLTVADGELMAIIGNSGSGKSTLLNMIGALDKPNAGKLMVNGENLLTFKKKDIVRYKRNVVGFVWQNNARNLIPYLSAIENVEVPMLIHGVKKPRERAMELLDMVEMLPHAKDKLVTMSGGEQQRIAIAIALSNNPRLLLADEPTGSVDTKTADAILSTFRKVNRQLGTTIVIVTHDEMLRKVVDRVVAIRDGRTSSEFIVKEDYKQLLQDLTLAQVIEQDAARHEELVVADQVGRLQLPQQALSQIGVEGKTRLRVTYEEDKIIITNPQKKTDKKEKKESKRDTKEDVKEEESA